MKEKRIAIRRVTVRLDEFDVKYLLKMLEMHGDFALMPKQLKHLRNRLTRALTAIRRQESHEVTHEGMTWRTNRR